MEIHARLKMLRDKKALVIPLKQWQIHLLNNCQAARDKAAREKKALGLAEWQSLKRDNTGAGAQEEDGGQRGRREGGEGLEICVVFLRFFLRFCGREMKQRQGTAIQKGD